MVMLNKDIEESLDDIINYITNSKEYIKCIEIKKKMSKNKKLTELIEDIKKLQKKYIKENDESIKEKDESIKEKLDSKEKELNEIPIYVEYNNNLEVVNNMINLVKDELNDYFYKLLNEKK